MAKWSGLSLDPDRNNIGLLLDHKPTVINSFQENNKNHHRFNNINNRLRLTNNLDRRHHPASSSSSVVATTAAQMHMGSSTVQFVPVHLNCNTSRDRDDDNREDINIHNEEMDFFATCNKKDSDSKNIVAADTKDLTESFNVNTGLHLVTGNSSSDQSMVDDGISPHSVDKRAKCEVVVLRAELERINTENRHIKEVLNRVTNDYTNLRMHLMTMMQQQPNNRTFDHMCEENDKNSKVDKSNQNGLILPRQFTELGLAATTGAETEETSLSSSEDQSGHQSARIIGRSPLVKNNIEGSPSGTYRSDSSPNKGSQGCGPNKVPRLNQPSNQATEATMRKARVSVRARSEAPMITDGCQWRKYGQKMAKGNPCPRAYYRCTMAAGCPVRKQVQRCAEDTSILITTYEGNHTHPLPPAAMAMASTTSSAARMLLSGSMPSADPHALINSNILARTLLPSCSSNLSHINNHNNNIATISASAPFPTVTLDLTQNPMNNNSLPFQNTFQFPPPNNNNSVVAALLPQIFGQSLYNQSKFSGLYMSSSQDNSENVHLGVGPQTNHHQGVVNALASDPTFTAALAAAITSLMSTPHPQNSNNNTSSSNIIDDINNNNTQNTSNTGNKNS